MALWSHPVEEAEKRRLTLTRNVSNVYFLLGVQGDYTSTLIPGFNMVLIARGGSLLF